MHFLHVLVHEHAPSDTLAICVVHVAQNIDDLLNEHDKRNQAHSFPIIGVLQLVCKHPHSLLAHPCLTRARPRPHQQRLRWVFAADSPRRGSQQDIDQCTDVIDCPAQELVGGTLSGCLHIDLYELILDEQRVASDGILHLGILFNNDLAMIDAHLLVLVF